MRKNVNKVHIEGIIYQLGNNERNRLSIKTVQNQSSPNFGKEFIGGDLDIATDEEGLNIVTVHFSYVTPVTAAGKTNATYAALKRIIEADPSWVSVGKEDAWAIKVDTALGLNEFISNDNRLVSAKRLEGGFVTILDSHSKLAEKPAERNNFKMDMIITNVRRVEADPERNIKDDYVVISGAVFDFKNRLLPADFKIVNQMAMNAFESMGISSSNPYYTHIRAGYIVNTNITVEKEVEGLFGVTIEPVTIRDHSWIVTQVNSEPYEFGNPDVMTVEELTRAMQDRELVVAEIKRNNEEYKASKAAPAPAAPKASAAPAMPAGGVSFGNFNF